MNFFNKYLFRKNPGHPSRNYNNEEYFESIIRVIPDLIVRCNKEGTYLDVISSSEDELIFPKKDLLGKKVKEVFPEAEASRMREAIGKALSTKTLQVIEYKLLTPSGPMWYESRIVPSGKKDEVIRLIRNITKSKQQEEAIRFSEKRFRDVAKAAGEYIWEMDCGFRYTYISERITEILRRPKQEIKGETPFGFMPENESKKMKKVFSQIFESGKPFKSVEFRFLLPEGDTIWINKNGVPVLDCEQKITGYRGVAMNITERKNAEDKIRFLSFHDTLTGLYNRTFVEEEMQRLDTERQLPISMIMCDLDGLKKINDSHGHNVGDEAIASAARIIKNSCRKEDIIARWGGDEFIVILPKTSEEECGKVVKRIKRSCEQQKTTRISLSISTGMAVKEKEEQNIHDIIGEADRSMYINKKRNI